MKQATNNQEAEKTAQKLSGFSTVSPNKRELLRGIVSSAPESLTRDAQLNTYFGLDNDEPQALRAGWLGSARAYVGIAVVALLVFGGGGIMWLGLSRQSQPGTTQLTNSQLQANGKVDNAVNVINQQGQSETQSVSSSQIDTSQASAADSQLQQMQESINEKF